MLTRPNKNGLTSKYKPKHNVYGYYNQIIVIDTSSKMATPRYKTLVDEFAQKIRNGPWVAGTRLPTHRVVARQYGIALATATKMYVELEKMGLVIGETGRGTYVRDL